MKRIVHSIVWAAMIIAAALIATSAGLGDAAGFAIVAGLSGAAWGAISADMLCGRWCLQ